MDGISDNQQNCLWSGLVHTDLKDAISGIRIVLDQDTVRAGVAEFAPLQVKIVDVLIGSLDL
jgi:hypothetical protein